MEQLGRHEQSRLEEVARPREVERVEGCLAFAEDAERASGQARVRNRLWRGVVRHMRVSWPTHRVLIMEGDSLLEQS